MKKYLLNILIFVMFFGGLAVLLYPSFSNYMNEQAQSTVIASYLAELDALSDEKKSEELEAARAYNSQLLSMLSVMDSNEIGQSEQYLTTLNLTESGIMGVLDIPRINVHLPIYHGTSDSVLQVAVGHLPASSLPVGGKGTHAILSAHTGLPSARLFTDLDELRINDMFTIQVMNETLVYQVSDILVVEPSDPSELFIAEDEDLVTLLTCTPYGINSHRLLVRGARVAFEEAERAGVFIERDAVQLDKMLLIPFAVIPADLIYFIFIAVRVRKQRSQKSKGRETAL